MALVVLGGTVLDIQAWPQADELRRGSSVPGHVSQLPGGVGRNIAEAAHHLLAQHGGDSSGAPGQPAVLLISVVGRDTAADALLASFQHARMSTAGIVRSTRAATPCVVAVLDRGGEVAASVADVAAPTLELTPALVRQHARHIAAAQLLVLDANLAQPTLTAAVRAAAAAGARALFEPVSVPKAARCVPILPSLYAITPNANELLAIADAVQQAAGLPSLPRPQQQQQQQQLAGDGQDGLLPQQLLAQLAPAAVVVLQQGLGCILLTMGHLGAAIITLSRSSAQPQPHPQQQQQQQQQQHQYQHQQQQQQRPRPGSSSPAQHGARRAVLRAQHIPAQHTDVVNLSGAGDTLVGGFAAALLRGRSPVQALAVGVAAARLSVQSQLNVPGPQQGLVYEGLQGAAAQLLAQQQQWDFPVVASSSL